MNPDLLLVAAVASVFSAVLSTAFAVVQVLALLRECRRKPINPPPLPPAASAAQPPTVEDWRATDADYARWCDEQEAEYFARLEAEDYAAWRLTRAAA